MRYRPTWSPGESGMAPGFTTIARAWRSAGLREGRNLARYLPPLFRRGDFGPPSSVRSFSSCARRSACSRDASSSSSKTEMSASAASSAMSSRCALWYSPRWMRSRHRSDASVPLNSLSDSRVPLLFAVFSGLCDGSRGMSGFAQAARVPTSRCAKVAIALVRSTLDRGFSSHVRPSAPSCPATQRGRAGRGISGPFSEATTGRREAATT